MTRYINKDIITKEHKTITLKLEELLMDAIDKMDIDYEIERIDRIEALKSINIINAFCKQNALSKIILEDIEAGSHGEGFSQALHDRLELLIIKEYDENLNNLFIQNNQMNDEEHQNIQNRINGLRDKINSTKELSDEHKSRILKKLNEMQAQLDKKISDGEIIKGKALSVINILSFGRKEVISPILKDTTDLIKAVNKMENKYSGLSEENEQIPYNDFLQIDNNENNIIDCEISN